MRESPSGRIETSTTVVHDPYAPRNRRTLALSRGIDRAAKTTGNDEAAARWLLLVQHHLDRQLADFRGRHS